MEMEIHNQGTMWELQGEGICANDESYRGSHFLSLL